MIKLIIIIYFLNLSLIFANERGNYTFNIDSTIFSLKLIEYEDEILFNILIDDSLILSHKYERLPYIQIEDINKDSILEIKLDFIDNNVVSYLYLFDAQNNSFRKVLNFENYSQARFIVKNLFYSYNSTGCADLNWASNLVLIDDFSIKVLASIFVTECNNELNEILVKDVINEEIIYLETYGSDKFEFIENYWNKYYKKFGS